MKELPTTCWNASVPSMVAYLDREEIAKVREKHLRNNLRKIKDKRLRKFLLALKRVLLDIPGPENLQGKKIQKALQIGRSRYFLLREKVDKTMPIDPYVGRRDFGAGPKR